jgi:hypothetical protein
LVRACYSPFQFAPDALFVHAVARTLKRLGQHRQVVHRARMRQEFAKDPSPYHIIEIAYSLFDEIGPRGLGWFTDDLSFQNRILRRKDR